MYLTRSALKWDFSLNEKKQEGWFSKILRVMTNIEIDERGKAIILKRVVIS